MSKVYRAPLRIGWAVARDKSGSHMQMGHPERAENFTWAFHDGVEIGPAMLARMAKKTGLRPEDS